MDVYKILSNFNRFGVISGQIMVIVRILNSFLAGFRIGVEARGGLFRLNLVIIVRARENKRWRGADS